MRIRNESGGGWKVIIHHAIEFFLGQQKDKKQKMKYAVCFEHLYIIKGVKEK